MKIRGYTVIEMMVVTTILAIFACLVVPNYLSMLDTQKRRAFYTEVQDLANSARETAILQGETVYVAVDSGANQVVVKQVHNDSQFTPADGSNGPTAPTTTSKANGQQIDSNLQGNIGLTSDATQDVTVRTITMPTGMAFGAFQLNGATSDSGSWKVRFFSDGTSDGGAVELNIAGSTKSLVISDRGRVSLEDGNIPDMSNETWPAGTFVQRQQ